MAGPRRLHRILQVGAVGATFSPSHTLSAVMAQGTDPRRKVSIFVGLSLDGFIARPDGGLDWLDGPPGAPPTPEGEDFGFADFMARTDALVMGRDTFDTLLGFDAWPYGDTPVMVLTHRSLDLPPDFAHPVGAIAGEPADVVERLAARGLRRLYVDGGRTVQSFLAAGLVDEMVLSRLPVLIGDGIPLFGALPLDLWWDHRETRVLPGGMVQSRYEARHGTSATPDQ